ncbi:MAG: SDR family NAD(P)-dependent oxidoreductase, partial [Actinomycetota bacterium]
MGAARSALAQRQPPVAKRRITADTREDDFDRVIDVNLKGTYFMSAAAIPHLETTRGCIINLSSDAGIQG